MNTLNSPINLICRAVYFLWCCVPIGIIVLAVVLPLAVLFLHYYGSAFPLPRWLGLENFSGFTGRSKYVW